MQIHADNYYGCHIQHLTFVSDLETKNFTLPSASGVAAREQAEVRSLVRKDDRKECDPGCKGNRKSPQDGECHKVWNRETLRFACLAVGHLPNDCPQGLFFSPSTDGIDNKFT